MSAPDMLQAALRYAGLGWRVFPLWEPVAPGVCACRKRAACGRDTGKHPRVSGGAPSATIDELTIRAWWGAWPHASIGIALPDQLFFVVDLDPLRGGDTQWTEICAQHAPLSPTVYQRTGSGGFHGLYRRPRGVELRGKLTSGIDVPTTHIVAAPSLHTSGARYEWIRSPFEHPIAEPSPWLVDRVTGRARACTSLMPTAENQGSARRPRADDPSVDAWNAVVELMRSGATDADVRDRLRRMVSYTRRAERDIRDADRWLELTVSRARESRAVADPWSESVRTVVMHAQYTFRPERVGKPELHSVLLQLSTESDGEVLSFQYVVLPLGTRRDSAKECFDQTIADLARAESWLDAAERKRLESALRGRRLDVVLPHGGRGRVVRMRRAQGGEAR